MQIGLRCFMVCGLLVVGLQMAIAQSYRINFSSTIDFISDRAGFVADAGISIGDVVNYTWVIDLGAQPTSTLTYPSGASVTFPNTDTDRVDWYDARLVSEAHMFDETDVDVIPGYYHRDTTYGYTWDTDSGHTTSMLDHEYVQIGSDWPREFVQFWRRSDDAMPFLDWFSVGSVFRSEEMRADGSRHMSMFSGNATVTSIDLIRPVPEPGEWMLIILAGGALAFGHRRWSRASC